MNSVIVQIESPPFPLGLRNRLFFKVVSSGILYVLQIVSPSGRVRELLKCIRKAEVIVLSEWLVDQLVYYLDVLVVHHRLQRALFGDRFSGRVLLG